VKKDDVYFNTNWLPFYSYAPLPSNSNMLFTETFDDVDDGIYFLRITNVAGNGLGRNGWSTLTNNTGVFWQVVGDDFTTVAKQAFMVKGFYGTTELVSGYSP
jgi:hypothetical protein